MKQQLARDGGQQETSQIMLDQPTTDSDVDGGILLLKKVEVKQTIAGEMLYT
jgi:hypothetical protein